MIIKTVNEFKLTVVHFGCPNGCRYGVGCQAFVSLGLYWAMGYGLLGILAVGPLWAVGYGLLGRGLAFSKTRSCKAGLGIL